MSSFSGQGGGGSRSFTMTINISENPNYKSLTTSDMYVGLTNYGVSLAGANSPSVSVEITSYNNVTGDVVVTVRLYAGTNAHGTVFICS